MEFIKTYESFKDSINEYGLSHDDAYKMLDIAAQYTSDAHQAANQMWSDAQDLYDYIVSDHIRSKKNKKDFYKSVKREFPEVKESLDIDESLITEAFNSSILRGLHNQESGSRWRGGLAKDLAKQYGLKLDQIGDGDFEILSDPSAWFKGKYKDGNHLGFFVDDNPKLAAYLKKNKDKYGAADASTVKNPGLLLSLVKGKVGLWHGLADNPGSSYSRYKKGSEERYGLLAKDWELRRAYSGFEGKPIQKVTIKNLKDAATKVLVLDLDKLRQKYDAKELKADRANQKKGATALQNPKDIKKANMDRYTKILRDAAVNTDIDGAVKEGLEKITKQITDAVNKGAMTKYGNFIVGISKKNKREVTVQDATNFMKNLLDDYQRFIDYNRQAKDNYAGTDREDDNYYTTEAKNYALRIKKNLEKIDNYTYGW